MGMWIDVSHHQGKIDWAAAKAGGVEGAMVRASIWLQEDERFRENVRGATAAGLHVGAYHYACAETVAEAEREAEYFLRTINPYRLDLPVAYDFEDPKRHTGMSKALSVEIVAAFLRRVEAAGYYAMLYTSASWMTARFAELPQYDKWVAHYGVECPAYAGEYGMWQYGVMGEDFPGSVPGVRGNCDVNHVYKDYPAIIRAAGLNGWSAASDGAGGPQEGSDYEALYRSEQQMRIAAEAERDTQKAARREAEQERDAALAKLAQIRNIVV